MNNVANVDFADAAMPVKFILKDQDLSFRLQQFVQDLDNLNALLGLAVDYSISAFSKPLKLTHRLLKMKLNDLKRDKCQSMLASHLYELMPETKEQQLLLPMIPIDLGSGVMHKFSTMLRKKQRPRKVNRKDVLQLAGIRTNVWRFLEAGRILVGTGRKAEISALHAL